MIVGYIRDGTARNALFTAARGEDSVLRCEAEFYLNETDRAKLTLPGTNRAARSLTQKNAVIELEDDGGTVFIGDVALTEQEDGGEIRVDLDGALGWLGTICKAPFQVREGDTSSPVLNFLTAIVDQYNAAVSTTRMLQLGAVTVTGNVVMDHHDEYVTMLDLLSEVREQLGGYVYIDYASGIPVLNYIAQPEAADGQDLEFGRNVLTVVNQLDFSRYASRVYVAGTDENDQLITSVATDETAEAAFGRVDVSLRGEGKTTEEIYAEALAELAARKAPLQNLTMTAVDLAEIGHSERLFTIGSARRAYCEQIGIDTKMIVRKIKRDYLNRKNSEVSFGRDVSTISSLSGSTRGGSLGGGGVYVLPDAVRYVPQNPTPAEQEIARRNIDAAAAGDIPATYVRSVNGNTGDVWISGDGFPVYTPQDFGAKGDGKTDDTQAINDAIAATSRGGTVFVPDGRYILSDTIRIPEWKMLALSGSVELLFLNINVSDPCIKISRYGRLKGNESLVIVPYNYAGHAVELSMTEELTNAEENATMPFYNTPGWRLARTVDGISIMKRRGSSDPESPGYDAAFKQTRVKSVDNIGGDGIYIGVDDDYHSSPAIAGSQWMTKVNAMIAGGFANGFHLEVIRENGRWMSDTYISGAVEGAETGVLIEYVTGGVYCDVIVQPSPALDGSGAQKPYAKNGIKVVSSANVDMSRSRVWDWSSDNTLVGESEEYRAYALYGACRGAVIHDFGMNDSRLPFHDRIYSNSMGNLMTAVIVGAKGYLPVAPKYAFYKNYRRGVYRYDYLNVAWRDPVNLMRFQMPISPLFPGSNPNQLYQLGYFDFADAEVPEAGFDDTLPRQTITIEENDDRGLYGYTNLHFDADTVTCRWNPAGYGTGGHIPIYFYSVDGSRRYVYRLVRDNTDIQQIYNCALSITNARRFVFDFQAVGAIGALSSETYKLIQPDTPDAEIYLAGSVAMKNGVPMICTESAVFGRSGTPTTAANVKQIALMEDVRRMINAMLYEPLDYIESDGASYIDTGIIPSATTKIAARFSMASVAAVNTAERQYVFGTYDIEDGATESRAQFYYGGSSDSSGPMAFAGFGGSYNFTYITPDTAEHYVTVNAARVSFDDLWSKTFDSIEFTAPRPVYLFACNADGMANYFSNGLRVQAVSIYDGDTRIARFVPCLRKMDGAVGMLDEDSGTFHENQGTGAFLHN